MTEGNTEPQAMRCRTCGAMVPLDQARATGHELVYRLEPKPTPFLMLHNPS